MAELVTVKGLKGKQNKKKWAKNIDVSGLLQSQAQQHTQQLRQQLVPDIQVEDDNKQRPPLDPNRFKNRPLPLSKPRYNNRITRNLELDQVDDPWNQDKQGKTHYKPTAVPAVIIPETGHSYNPREEDIGKL